eukprot:346836_1
MSNTNRKRTSSDNTNTGAPATKKRKISEDRNKLDEEQAQLTMIDWAYDRGYILKETDMETVTREANDATHTIFSYLCDSKTFDITYTYTPSTSNEPEPYGYIASSDGKFVYRIFRSGLGSKWRERQVASIASMQNDVSNLMREQMQLCYKIAGIQDTISRQTQTMQRQRLRQIQEYQFMNYG